MKGRTDVVAERAIVRMYNVGFGDCFLVLAPMQSGVRKILFDCGSLESARLKPVIKQIVHDITDPDGVPRIDVVVATHRHRDHVLGFADPVWKTVEVREVWMPWTEDPADADAKATRSAQHHLAVSLYDSVSDLNDWSPEQINVRELAKNALSDETAMDTLHNGFGGQPRRFYLASSSSALDFRSGALPGIGVYILGPGRDPEVIRDLSPPPHVNMALAELSSNVPSSLPEPFRPSWWVAPHRYSGRHISDEDRQDLESAAAVSAEMLATTLDRSINATSLMLVLKIGSAHLLFSGDAQWATWRIAMRKPEWRRLLERTRFHKVGHHGSQSGTPRYFLERIAGDDFWCMISTCRQEQWPEIPKAELLKMLRRKTKKIARSDQARKVSRPAFTTRHGVYIQAEIPL